MDFSWSEEHQAFRQEVQAFIKSHWNGGSQRGRDDASRAYVKALADNGWLTLAWPKEYGGRGASHFQQLIFMEESSINGVPNGGQGADRVGPVLMIHGTQKQKEEHLPKIAHGEVNWCQGFSEPGAGSDLASLQTRAIRDGDDFVINGQKIWTSGAKSADWIHVLTRTDPEAAKQVEATGLKPHLHVGVGQAADTVVAFADKLGCSQIVMGTRGLGGMTGLLLGSVARDVAGQAKMPVTLLR